MPHLSPEEESFRDGGDPADLFWCVNPTSRDFSFSYKDDRNVPHLYLMRAGESKLWPRYIVSHYVKHLADREMDLQGVQTNQHQARKQWLGKIVLRPGNEDDLSQSAKPPRGERRSVRTSEPETVSEDEIPVPPETDTEKKPHRVRPNVAAP